MTAAAPIPTATESPLMDQPTDTDTAGRSGATPEAPLSGHAPPTRAAGPTLRSQMAENPLATFLGAVVVALLVTMFTTLVTMFAITNARIDRLEDRVDAGFAAVDARFVALEAKFDDKIEKLDDKIDELDRRLTAQIDELDRKLTALIAELDRRLTALIAALGATEVVDAAMEGRLLGVAGDSVADPAVAADPADLDIGTG